MTSIKSHVRCLTYEKPFLLAGIGSFVFVWYRNDDHQQYQFIRSIPFSVKQNIIGIKFLNKTNHDQQQQRIERQLIIYSIHYMYYCSIYYNPDNIFDNFELIINNSYINHYMILDLIDWNNNLIIIINARNEIIIRNLVEKLNNNNVSADDDEQQPEKIFGPQKCILYSAKILESSIDNNCLIIASGTVFTQILIWSVVLSSNNDEKPLVEELQTLNGHDGVIFAIDYNSKLNILVTASDDRSVRLWNGCCDNFSESSMKNNHCSWKMNKFQLTHTYYGHEARIWRVMITTTRTDSPNICISVGEDSSLIVWSLQQPYGMIRRKRFIRNNRIWSLCTTNNDDDHQQIICGGSDSSIQLTYIEDILQLNQFKINEWNQKLSYIKAIGFLRTNKSNSLRTITACIKGEFFCCDNDLKKEKIEAIDDQEYNLNDIFGDYIKMAANSKRNMIIVGSKFGHLGLMMTTDSNDVKFVYLQKIFERKIIDISFIDDDDQLMICLLDGLVKIVHIIVVVVGENYRLIIDKHDYRLPNSKHQWCSCGHLYKNLFIVGDYSGNVLGYWTDKQSSEPFRKFWHIHGQNGVTSIRRQPESRFIYSSGRNGRIIEYLIIENENNMIVDFQKLRTYASFSSVEWICGFEFDRQTQRPCFVYGFDWRKFIVWNIDNDQNILFEEDCGGGHRSFDVSIEQSIFDDDELIQIDFCYSKSDTIKHVGRCCHSPKFPKSKLSFSTIPRKINCCTQMIIDQQSSLIYCLIAGEDRSIQIISYDENNIENSFKLVEILYGHIATINAIKCLTNINQMTYAISVGSRSQMIIWRFWYDHHDQKRRLICEEKSMNFLGLFNKQLEFETKIRKPNDQELLELDVRYLDVDFIEFRNNENAIQFHITVACSDASYRIFNYNERDNKIEIFHKIQLGMSCLLRCKIFKFSNHHLHSKDGSTGSNIFSSAVTTNDGYIHFFSIDHQNSINNNDDNYRSSLLLSRQIHRSGIIAIDWKFINNEILIIATGGDDNQIIITLINVCFVDDCHDNHNGSDLPHQQVRLNFLRSFSSQQQQQQPSYNNHGHTCQITDVKFIDKNDYRNLISISIDQQIISWCIHMADKGLDQDDQDHGGSNDAYQKLNKPSNNGIDSIRSINRHLISISDVSSFCSLFNQDGNNNDDQQQQQQRINKKQCNDNDDIWLICGDGFQSISRNQKKNS
ncbi:tRNA (34-2'-O)-methyltransferase regulator WDR6 [Dermatophagoides pteronyssinus]|uniref:tRNA (34-2'-O)-methyltransferase regulator WDR6 n=1 Tax=Dermatophagoides pteronyssinus TaxID=6956 RepID=UPI003F681525